MKQQTDGSSTTPPNHWSAHSSGWDQGMRVLSYLIGGVLAYGALGWLGDRLLGTAFLLPVGIILGAALSVYVIIIKFGKVTDGTALPNRTERFATQWRRRVSGSGQGVGRR